MSDEKINIKLNLLSKSNWEDCVNLKVAKGQEEHLPSNLVSIAELNFYPETKAVAICTESTEVVGFATYGISVEDESPKIFRFMIGELFQRQGYGKAALVEIAKELFDAHQSQDIQVCYQPGKGAIKNFYASVGFKEVQVIPCKQRKEGKMLAVLKREVFESLFITDR